MKKARRTLKHERLRERIIRLAAGELSSWEAWWLRRHLIRCPDCQTEWETITRLAQNLATLGPLPSIGPAPVWTDGPAQPHSQQERKGLTMNYRTLVVACLTLLVFGSAAVGTRQWLNRPYGIGFGGRSGNGKDNMW